MNVYRIYGSRREASLSSGLARNLRKVVLFDSGRRFYYVQA